MKFLKDNNVRLFMQAYISFDLAFNLLAKLKRFTY